jgi:cellulose synthase/poly-beta-1,6-N-acetylglucosamine synthase-like glycosyltransferase
MMALWVWRAVWALNAIVLAYFVLLNTVYLLASLVAFKSLRRYVHRLRSLDVEALIGSGAAPAITLVVPAYNEEATCVEATHALLTLRYSEYEVVVVNDGSRDRTLAVLTEAFDLVPAARLASAAIPTNPVRQVYRSRRHPNFWVVDKENGGKADALNAGLNACRTPLFCVIDADSILEPDALMRVARPFLEDERTVAVGGIVRIANGSSVAGGRVRDVRLPRSLLARLQVLEYLRAFLSGRVAWAELNATLIISGAFGLFKRGVVVDAGGYHTDTVGEDMELVVRLHRHCRERGIAYRITFVPDPVAWTECPETIGALARQRDRWQRGLAESLVPHRRMLFNPRYGSVGLLAFPYFFFLEMLGPVVEVLGYIAFVGVLLIGAWSSAYVLAFLSLAIFFGIALSAAAVGLEELTFRRYSRWSDLRQLFWLAVVENAGYRQLTAWWRVRGLISSLFRVRRWGHQTRKGFDQHPAPSGGAAGSPAGTAPGG